MKRIVMQEEEEVALFCKGCQKPRKISDTHCCKCDHGGKKELEFCHDLDIHQTHIQERVINSHWQAAIISGCFAGASANLVSHPLDTVKTRMQVYHTAFFRTCFQIYKKEKIFGFYKGCGFPVLTGGALSSVMFGVYQTAEDYLSENLTPDDRHRYRHLINMFCGGLGGVCQTVIASPTETVKIRLQTQTHSYLTQLLTPQKVKYHSPWHCAGLLIASGGFASLYQGTSAVVCRLAVSQGLFFTLFHLLRSTFEYSTCNDREPRALKRSSIVLLSGMLAAVPPSFFSTPFEVIGTRMKADMTYNKGFLHCARHLIKINGWGFLTAGWKPVAIRNAPYSGVSVMVYDLALRNISPY